VKATFARKTLLAALKHVGGAVAGKNTKKELRCVKLLASNVVGCRLEATDNELSVRVQFEPLIVDDGGAILVPAAALQHVITEATAESVALETDKSTLTVSAGFGSWDIGLENAEAFPSFPEIDDKAPCHRVSAETLKELTERTIFAAAAAGGNARFGAMSGVVLEFAGVEAQMVATDGHRMAIARGPFAPAGAPETNPNVPHVLPVKALRLLAGLLEEDQVVSVHLDANSAVIVTSTATIWTKLCEGRYPPWQSILPKPNSKATMKAGPIVRAARQAAIFHEAGDYEFSPSKLTVKAKDETGRATVRVEEIGHMVGTKTIRLDNSYLLDMLGKLGEDEEVEIGFPDAKADNSGLLLQAGLSYDYVLMPLVGGGK
jgi:DNA polymerase-3 subunit beta